MTCPLHLMLDCDREVPKIRLPYLFLEILHRSAYQNPKLPSVKQRVLITANRQKFYKTNSETDKNIKLSIC